MIKAISTALGLLLLLVVAPLYSSQSVSTRQHTAATTPVSTANIEVYFSPSGGCTDAIVREINNAKSSIHIQAYSFTSVWIAEALLGAQKRGIKIHVLLDKSNRTDRYSSATFLNNQGIAPLIDDNHAIAHNKVIIIDSGKVITGSFNFSKAAEERNAENLLIITDPTIAKKYLNNWQLHSTHSESFRPNY